MFVRFDSRAARVARCPYHVTADSDEAQQRVSPSVASEAESGLGGKWTSQQAVDTFRIVLWLSAVGCAVLPLAAN